MVVSVYGNFNQVNLRRAQQPGRKDGSTDSPGDQQIHPVFREPAGTVTFGNIFRDSQQAGKDFHLTSVRVAEEAKIEPVKAAFRIPGQLGFGNHGRIMRQEDDIIRSGNARCHRVQIRMTAEHIIDSGHTDPAGFNRDEFNPVKQRRDAGI